MSPNLAINQISSPKGISHPLPQRQSINDALKSQVSGPGAQGQGRFSYNASGMPNQQNPIIKKQQQSSQGVVNLNSMKGFFSARGQGMRSGEKS